MPLLTNADFSAGGNRDLPLGHNGTANTYASGLLQRSYEIDFWGKNKASLAAAEVSLKANIYDHQTVALTMTSGIVSIYLQVLSLHDRFSIARKNVANAERVLALVEAQSSARGSIALGFSALSVCCCRTKGGLARFHPARAWAPIWSVLAILLGRSSQTFKIGNHGLDTISLPDVTPGLPSELLFRRPDIRLTGLTGAQSSALLSFFNAPNLLVNVGTSLAALILNAGLLKN